VKITKKQLQKIILEELAVMEGCGSMVSDEPMPVPGPPPEGAGGMEPAFDDHEGRMAKSQLFKMAKYSNELMNTLDDHDQLPSWVQAKITKAADYLGAVKHYLEYEKSSPPMHENRLSGKELTQLIKEVITNKD
jgi:hypothetical protein